MDHGQRPRERGRSPSDTSLPAATSGVAGWDVGGGSISVCIVCRNEADRLASCLESARWADETVVMDLESMDGSVVVAERYGARVISRPPHPIVEPLRNELGAIARGAWVLALDPDECVTPGLASALRQLARRGDLDAVVIPRMNIDFGYPPGNPLHRYEPQLRMYRRAAVNWPIVPNALPRVPLDRVYRLPAFDELVLVHNRNRTIPEALERAIRYAPAEAQSMLEHGRAFSARAMAADLVKTAHRHLIRAEAWRDGVPGILRAATLLNYKFNVWASFWQLSGAQRVEADDRFLRRLSGPLVAAGHLVDHYLFLRRVMAHLRRPSGKPRGKSD